MKYFTKGICNYLNPEYSAFIDIGTEVQEDALYKLFKYMHNNEHCVGCCGEIEVEINFKECMKNYEFSKYLLWSV